VLSEPLATTPPQETADPIIAAGIPFILIEEEPPDTTPEWVLLPHV
jgi:hypothetical protein